MRLSDFRLLSFDCFGTLIDWETGIVRAIAPWLEARGVSAGPEQILAAFSAAESPQQQATPGLAYPALLAEVHGAMARHFGLEPDAAAAAAFGASVGDWPAFEDSPAALAHLKRHFQLVILSNVDRASFALSNARLGVTFDAIYTAQDIGSYKPNPGNFRYLLDHLAERGVAPGQILHTAESLYHDHLPAQRLGLATCWIHRRAGKPGHGATQGSGGEVRPDFRFASLAAMVEAHRAELAQANGPPSP